MQESIEHHSFDIDGSLQGKRPIQRDLERRPTKANLCVFSRENTIWVIPFVLYITLVFFHKWKHETRKHNMRQENTTWDKKRQHESQRSDVKTQLESYLFVLKVCFSTTEHTIKRSSCVTSREITTGITTLIREITTWITTLVLKVCFSTHENTTKENTRWIAPLSRENTIWITTQHNAAVVFSVVKTQFES